MWTGGLYGVASGRGVVAGRFCRQLLLSPLAILTIGKDLLVEVVRSDRFHPRLEAFALILYIDSNFSVWSRLASYQRRVSFQATKSLLCTL